MSRIGKKPIELGNVKAELKDGRCYLESAKGKLDYAVNSDLECKVEGQSIILERKGTSKHARAMWGTTRALLANAVKGLTEGFSEKLELKGVGYKAKLQGKTLNLAIGFTPFDMQMPDDVDVACPTATQIVISGINKQRVGQVAAEIAATKKPDAYQGYGIRYARKHYKLKAVAKK